MRGQVAVLGLVAGLIIIGSIGFFAIREPSTPMSNPVSFDLERCLENYGLSVVRDIGLTGVGSSGPTHSIDGDRVRIAILAYEPGSGVVGAPSSDHVFVSRSGLYTFPNRDELMFVVTERLHDVDCSVDAQIRDVTYAESFVSFDTVVREQGRSTRTITTTIDVPLLRYHAELARMMIAENEDLEHVLSAGSDYRILSDDVGEYTLVSLVSIQPVLGAEEFRFRTLIENRPPLFKSDPDCSGAIDPDDGDTLNIWCDSDSIYLDTNRGEWRVPRGSST